MRKLIFILIALSFLGCGESVKLPVPEPRVTKTGKFFYYAKFGYYEVIEIDGCEYLDGYRQLAHKGNCKNPIHCYNH